MLGKYLSDKTETIKIVLKLIFMVSLCIFIVSALFSIVSVALCKLDFTYNILPLLTTIISASGSALSGLVISRLTKQNGLFWGVFAGVVITLCILITSACFNCFNLSFNTFIKTAIIIISGAIGGVIGVNTN